MVRLFKRLSKKIGAPPGSFVFIGEKKMEEVKVTVMDYNEKELVFKEVESVEDIFPYKDSQNISWINIYGLHDPKILEQIGAHFGIHHLVVEDIANTAHRPKIEVFDDYVFIVLKMIWYDEEGSDLQVEQISLIYGKNFVLCFQEREGDVFQTIRERLKDPQTRLRKSGADYLTYRIMDVVVDNYFLVLEKLGDEIEALDEEIVDNPRGEVIQKIYELKRHLIFLRKAIWPLREIVSSLTREESRFFKKSIQPFLRDLYDHSVQIIDTIETYRDLVSGLLDIYMSNISNKMNEVMKVLTIIATIFIPLTFLAGVYGMNFEYMPELGWKFAYPVVWAIMLSIGLGMFIYFKRKGWF